MLRWIRSDEEVVQKRYLGMLETELAYYRDKFDGERKRGDRINDELLQRTGSLPVSDLGIREKSEAEEQMKESIVIMQAQMAEIYGDGVQIEETAEPESEETKA